jgi:hypothetical protein
MRSLEGLRKTRLLAPNLDLSVSIPFDHTICIHLLDESIVYSWRMTGIVIQNDLSLYSAIEALLRQYRATAAS